MSSRMDAVQAPIIPIVGELIRTTRGRSRSARAWSRWGPPPAAIEAARESAGTWATHRYGAVEGDPRLLEVLARKLRDENGLDLTGSRVFVTAGSNMAFQSVVLAISQPGDEIVLPAPFYFNHEMAVRIAGCNPVIVPTDRSSQLDLDRLTAAITPRTRAIVTVSPNNPTGAVYPEDALRAVNHMCAARGILHVADEAYRVPTYDRARHFSPGSLPGASAHTISLYSLSKTYGFAGWRVGYAVVRRPSTRRSTKCKTPCSSARRCLPGRGHRRVGYRTCVVCTTGRASGRRAAPRCWTVRADSRSVRCARPWRRLLLSASSANHTSGDDDDGAAGARASRRGDRRRHVRSDGRLLSARVVWGPGRRGGP